MKKILSITGTRSDYGLMTPVYKLITAGKEFELAIIVTGMHLLPDFGTSLNKVKEDAFGKLYFSNMLLGEDSGKSMSQSLGLAIFGFSAIIDEYKPDIILLQGDRGEMLAGAIAGAHMNIPVVHMSGGDFSGSIDDSIRNAISKFAHFHLTTCDASTQRLIKLGEDSERIFEVGEPMLDLIKEMNFKLKEELMAEFDLNPDLPVIIATQHPVTSEFNKAVEQIKITLDALEELGLQTVFTYPNSDAGGREMIKVLESYKEKSFIRIIPNLGIRNYLSLMKIASVMVGNSSSGILEAPSFKLPVVNIGTRQYGRMRANNVVDVDYDKSLIKNAINFCLENINFRTKIQSCVNPYGNGTAALKTIDILLRLNLSSGLITKWIKSEKFFLDERI